MRSFKDRDGVEWQVSVTLGLARRIKLELGVDLLSNSNESNGFLKLSQDVELLAISLYTACEKQAKDRNVADVDAFLSRLEGDSIQSATDAFLWAVIDFFPEARKREMMSKVMNEFRALKEKALSLAGAKIDEEMAEAESRMEVEMIAGLKSTELPVPAASTANPLTA
jgi:hypothetical protein